MYYIVKKKESSEYLLIKAFCDRSRVWHNAWGMDKHYEYHGIDEDNGEYFDSRQIVKKSTAKTKEKVKILYPEYFL